MSDEFTIDSVSIYEVSPFNLGSMIKYSPRPGAIEEWEYKLKPGEHICEDCGGVIRDDNASLHMRCKRKS